MTEPLAKKIVHDAYGNPKVIANYQGNIGLWKSEEILIRRFFPRRKIAGSRLRGRADIYPTDTNGLRGGGDRYKCLYVESGDTGIGKAQLKD